MQRFGKKVFGLMAIAGLSAVATFAQSNPAVGLWKSEEPDKTTLIRTYEENGKLMGKVEKLVKKDVEDTTSTCTKCTGESKDKPIVGLPLIWDMKKDGAKWTGGKILEPDTGKVYACKIEPSPDGKKLNVRGSILFLGKTQVWARVE